MSDVNYSISEVESFAARFYGGARLLITPYAYNTIFTSLSQGSTQSSVINIAANADFLLMGIHHRAQIGAAQTNSSKTAPYVRVLLTDSGSNEQFTAQPVDLENYSNGSNFGNNLPYPRIIAGRSTINVSVTNFAPTAETYTTLDIMLEGVLVRALS